jgi:TnpA family transposase
VPGVIAAEPAGGDPCIDGGKTVRKETATGAQALTAQVDWDLIATLLPDMTRVAISIRTGNILPSDILRRLNSSLRKNKLYFGFRELGE